MVANSCHGLMVADSCPGGRLLSWWQTPVMVADS